MTDMARISSLLCLMSRNFEKWELHYICMLIGHLNSTLVGRNELNIIVEPPLSRQLIKQPVTKAPK